MSGQQRQYSQILSTAFLLVAVVAVRAHAQQAPTVEGLVDKLQNRAPVKRVTRGLFIEDIQSSEGRKKLADDATRYSLPAADVEVYFDFNSAIITPGATPILMTLGKVLSDRRLAGGTFVIAGHTDAKGGPAYNQKLSEQRAKAVRNFLIEKFAIDPRKLIAIGYGEEKLKKPTDPFAAENRRVQIINWTGVAAR